MVEHFYKGMQKIALSRGALAAIAASSGIIGGGVIGVKKSHADLMMNPNYRKMGPTKRGEYRKAQATNAFIDGGLKGGTGAALITDLVFKKVL